jgi:glycine dehydrogenase subunit 2
MRSLFEMSTPGKTGVSLPEPEIPSKTINHLIPENMLAEAPPELPELSEIEVVRHFINLSRLNFSVDSHFYPLGSCTMKYNPKINEKTARLNGFNQIHPYLPEEHVQGALALLWNLQQDLMSLTGMEAFSLQPAAGAHGELTALLIIRAYFDDRKEKRTKILVPDSSHGTNPASAAMAGFEAVEIKSDRDGNVDQSDLDQHLSDEVACLMLTNPNTLGLFDTNIELISSKLKALGALLYYDGANLNAIMGKVRPGDMGFDLVHLNLHKTFSTPHGGGGPGAGPVGTNGNLKAFLPAPIVIKEAGNFKWAEPPKAIGRMKAFYGNFLVLVKAYTYIKALGAAGLQEASETAVLNANYLMRKLQACYSLPFDRTCMHEFVLSASRQKAHGVKALDIAKRLLDYGFHAPTIYFPHIVEEALMIEPTETESLQTLDEFARIMCTIAGEAETQAQTVQNAPHNTPISRADEVQAARKPVLKWKET